jgi:hypothetical protein
LLSPSGPWKAFLKPPKTSADVSNKALGCGSSTFSFQQLEVPAAL